MTATFHAGDRVAVPNGRTGTVVAELGYLGRYSETPAYTVHLDNLFPVTLPASALKATR